MPAPSGTFQTFQAVGNREDLSDMIWDISPTEVPFSTRVAKTKASAIAHEWQIDALDAPAVNAQIEGDDAVVNTAVPTVRAGNRTQILAKTVIVSGTQDSVSKAGRETELAYQVMKRMKEIKRDLEFALVGNAASTAGTGSAARRMAGVETWLASNRTSVGTGTAQTTFGLTSGFAATAPLDSTVLGTFTEASLRHVIQLAYVSGGDPTVVMVTPGTKAKMSSTFTGIATRFRDVAAGSQAQIISGADVYVSDFGKHTIIPNRFMRNAPTPTSANTALVLDMEYWALATLRPLRQVALGKTGDNEKRQLVMEATLVSRNQAASGKITDINPLL